ncbi:hypothetical protein JAAARDRAFT_118968 [Jaapia argillacea MUCL 33604]|uniref:PXA domain-containing protein n=1 Tax=Jaapia argillacea MUCL 33604 TaxID=933084 RepID=A0A067QCH9_9AGAM|nr:hypothetical protein JAAARDRAFT_118968 [Jaapia argillacea MUCL 33604]
MAAAQSRRRPGTRSIPSSSVLSSSPVKVSQPIPLPRRLLFPNLPLDIDLPPISDFAPSELNAELYDFVALSLRAFVNPWWTKITRYDKEFVAEVNRVLTIVVRSLEARLLNTDLSPLVFRDLPTLITQHYRDFRNASAKLSTSYSSGGAASFSQLFHQSQPHMAISPEGTIHEDYVRQVADHILKTCLPPEDYDPETERYIIREIILKVILGSVIPRLTQPWFIHKLILDLLSPTAEGGKRTEVHAKTRQPSQPLSLHVIAVFFLSAIQILSGFGIALIQTYKQAVQTIRVVNQSPPRFPPHAIETTPPELSLSNTNTSPISPSASLPPLPPQPISQDPSAPNLASPSPMAFAAAPVTMISELFTMHDRFTSSTIMSNIEMVIAFASPFLDKLLPYMLYTHILSSAQITNVVRIGKRTLFPNGYPAPPPVDPSVEEQAIIRAQLEAKLLEKFPSLLSSVLLGPTPVARSETIKTLLDPLSSAAANAHLFLFILDAIIITLFPELGVGGTAPDANNGATVAFDVEGYLVAPGTMSRTVSITPPGSTSS